MKRRTLSFALVAVLMLALVLVPMFVMTASAAEESGEWKLVTDASTLKAGDKIVIACNTKDVVAGALSGKYLSSVTGAAFSSDKSTITTLPSDAMEFTLGGSTGAWTLQATDGQYIYESSAKNLAATTSVKTWTISISSGDAVVKGTNPLRYNSSAPRFTTYASGQTAIQLYRFEADTCAHTNTTTETVDAKCEVEGSITVTCDDCGKVISTDVIDALEHNYVDGVCSLCGAAYTAEPKWVLKDISQILPTDVVVIVATKSSGTFAMFNDNGTGSAPDAVAVTVNGDELDGEIADNVKWNISNVGGTLTIYPNGDTSKWLYCTASNNGVRVGTNTANAFTIDSTGYLKHTGTSRFLGVYNTQDWRCYTSATTANIDGQSFAFYVYEVPSAGGDSECEHANTTTTTVDATCTASGSITEICDDCQGTVSSTVLPATGHVNTTTVTEEATCTTPGKTTVTCDKCGVIVSETVIPAGHKYVDGVCTGCGAAEPNYAGRYYIAAIRSSGNYWWMTSDLGSASTKRYQAVDSDLTTLPAAAVTKDGYVFVLEKNSDGTYKIYAEGVDGNNYLGWSSGNSGILVAAEDALSLTVEEAEGGTLNIHFTASDAERYLALNDTSGSNYFAWYKSGQKQDLSLVPVKDTPEIVGAQVNVGADLAIKYHVSVPYGYDASTLTLKITNAHGTVTLITESTVVGGNYVFVYGGIAPQCMSDAITAELLAGEEVIDTLAEYSIVKNAKNLAAAEGASAELKQLLADLLAYGMAAQAYLGDKHTVSSVTADDIAEIGTPSAGAPESNNSVIGEPTTEEAYISGAGVRFDTQVQLYVTVKGTNAANAKVKVGGEWYDVEDVDGKYRVYLPGMNMSEISALTTIELYLDEAGESVHTVQYGAYAYAYQMITGKPGTAIAALAQALYNCAESAAAYVN